MLSTGRRKHWLGLDIGGTKMLSAAFSAKLSAEQYERRKTRAYLRKSACLDLMVSTIRASLSAAGLRQRDLAGIGVGVAGPVDPALGLVIDTPNLGLKRFPLKAFLEKQFGCAVAVLNDADAGIYGEYRLGSARGARCALGVFVGTGIGAGCVYEGRVLSGSRVSCFELGHLRVLPGGPRCGCGQRGCLEALAARPAIAAASAVAASRGQAPALREDAGTDVSKIGSKALARAIAGGDEAVADAVRIAARWVGAGVATVVNLLAPDVVVLGGGLVEELPDLFREEVLAEARDRAMPALRRCFKVRTASLGELAVAQGAAAWAQFQSAGRP